MNVNWANHIEDTGKIESEALISFLEKYGWVDITPEKRDTPEFWLNEDYRFFRKIVDGGLYELKVPMKRTLNSYSMDMLKAVVEIINSQEADRVRRITAMLTKTSVNKEKAQP